ncbi:MAG: sulfite exporter TauE/SafE family protein, partial [Spirochaetaceae bacterium]|nr:sulfite exporter TauE/SafE family protein [Spirochaetaceae bacterium]
MSFQRIVVYVDGMTCTACESRISGSLRCLQGVRSAKASVRGGKVDVEFDDSLTDRRAVEAAIAKAGYPVRRNTKAGTTVTLGFGLLLVAAYLAASSSGVFSSLPAVDASLGYAALFAVGLLTSIHCVAMCGGIALSQSLRRAASEETPESPAGAFDRLTPGLLYNAGRVLSYTVAGG